jgi:hypothetical protein
MIKKCTTCQQEKEISEFPKNKLGRYGVHSICKECKRNHYNINRDIILEQKKDYHQKNKETISEQKKQYHINNKDLISEKKRQSYKKNKESILAKRKEYYNNNKHLLKDKKAESGKKYREKNKEKINNRIQIWTKNKKETDPEFKLKNNIRCRFTDSLKIKLENKIKPFFEYTGISFANYIDHFKTNYPAEFSELTIKGKYHIDHIIPCAIYDFNNPDDIKKCWNPENLRIIPAEENRKKNDKIDFDLIKKHNIEHLLPESFDEFKYRTS